MRVLLIANTLPPVDISGVGEQVLQLQAALQEEGHEVRVLGRGAGGARGTKLVFPVTAIPATLRAMKEFAPDVVQVHESDGALVALIVAAVRGTSQPVPRLVALLQVSYLEEFRAVRPIRWGGRVLGRPGLAELLFKWVRAPLHVVLGCLATWVADLVLAPSRKTAAELERDYGAENVRVLPNVTGGRDVSTVSDGSEEEDGFLLFIGRLRLRKGVEVLLQAMAALSPTLDGRLLIAGDGETRDSLERLSSKLGLQERVRFLGRCSAERIRALLRGARALIVPSLYEGMPLVVLEAMESGVPVVASSVSGIPEVVVHQETGWLVPAEDPPALAAAMTQALSDPQRARAVGAAGRQRLNELYRPANAASTWLNLLAMEGETLE